MRGDHSSCLDKRVQDILIRIYPSYFRTEIILYRQERATKMNP
ncbi:hypothetical protein THICB1_100491 [Thiomonas arsenitoxydans]|uniref:Uncharacterized protein n=1 Tax=Thiomonas arsenitoxydans (strain DSM 22701 / CIP 110005 / 3As) TaxID=426114 RepID=A0ABM9T0R9_THIA3|nr:hypothetical protein THICB1_100491 [Thiomonas arsenitoxydans]CQR32754.1 hypothetical protein THICB6_160289 [Thiomonas arsenitoxydans]